MKDGPLYNRYTITHKDGEPLPEDDTNRYFVLSVDTDPAARVALAAYAVAISPTHPTLARDIRRLYLNHEIKYCICGMTMDETSTGVRTCPRCRAVSVTYGDKDEPVDEAFYEEMIGLGLVDFLTDDQLTGYVIASWEIAKRRAAEIPNDWSIDELNWFEFDGEYGEQYSEGYYCSLQGPNGERVESESDDWRKAIADAAEKARSITSKR